MEYLSFPYVTDVFFFALYLLTLARPTVQFEYLKVYETNTEL